MTPNGIEIFNPLEHGIHGKPLMVPAHEYNRMLGVLVEARAYIARHTTPTVTEATHGSIVDRIDAITAPRQASNPAADRPRVVAGSASSGVVGPGDQS